MKDSKDKIYRAIARLLSGKAGEKDRNTLADWIAKDATNKLKLDALEDYWSHQQSDDFNKEEVFAVIEQRIAAEQISTGKKTKVVPLRHFWLKVAATIIIAFGIGYSVAVYLENAEMNSLAASITKIEKATPMGQKSIIYLSDGSKVTLNAGSKITYYKNFKDDERLVSLIGEAYFEVAKDANRPFRVITGDLTTTALGTAFNVNAYPSHRSIVVSLVEGSVGIQNEKPDDGFSEDQILKAGEALTFELSNRTIDRRRFNVSEVISWKEGVLTFKNANFSQVVEKLEYWYGVDFVISENHEESWALSASFDNQSLENVLNSLSYTKGFKFSIEEQKVFIKF